MAILRYFVWRCENTKTYFCAVLSLGSTWNCKNRISINQFIVKNKCYFFTKNLIYAKLILEMVNVVHLKQFTCNKLQFKPLFVEIGWEMAESIEIMWPRFCPIDSAGKIHFPALPLMLALTLNRGSWAWQAHLRVHTATICKPDMLSYSAAVYHICGILRVFS